MGVDTGIVFLSRRIAELLGGGNFTTPPRDPRYKIRSAVRGLRSNVLLLLEMIFDRDGSFYVSNNDAPFCSRQDLVSFISLIYTA